jgi:hypothetical protein
MASYHLRLLRELKLERASVDKLERKLHSKPCWGLTTRGKRCKNPGNPYHGWRCRLHKDQEE